MAENTLISWCDHSFSPWHGCTKIAHPQGSGCDHCYADTLSIRFGHRNLWGKDADRRIVSDHQWRQPHIWNADAERLGEPAFVFCASMGDVFENREDLDAPRARLFTLIEDTPWLVWLLLTKRPEQVPVLARGWMATGWPANVWLGASVEHQAAANLRIPRLLAVPAPMHFLSVEPMLGPIDFGLIGPTVWPFAQVDWIIVGGESGSGHRELDLEAVRLLIEQCDEAEVPVWTKQDSGHHAGRQGRIPADLWRHQRPQPARPRLLERRP